MKIERFAPSTALMPFVKEYLLLESELETVNTTLPDTSMVMAFRFRGQVLKTDGGLTEALPAGAFSGLRRTVRYFHYGQGAATLLVVFREQGLAAFSRIPAHELFGLSISSGNVFTPAQIAEMTERLEEAATHPERIACLEAFLLRNRMVPAPDALVGQAIDQIKNQSGRVRIKTLAGALCTTQDTLEKRFRAQVGASPKQYASIVRLRGLLAGASSASSLTEASYETGYFDQAHFIKDFRLFTGKAPGEFFKSAPYW